MAAKRACLATRASVAIAALAVLVGPWRGRPSRRPPLSPEATSRSIRTPSPRPTSRRRSRRASPSPPSQKASQAAILALGLAWGTRTTSTIRWPRRSTGAAWRCYRRGAAAEAKTLFIESLERSPKGRVSADALRMLRAANRRLGIANLDDGRPSAQGREGVLDPYAGGAGGAPAPSEAPLDPYGAAPTPEPPEPTAPVEPVGPDDRPEPEQGSAWAGAR